MNSKKLILKKFFIQMSKITKDTKINEFNSSEELEKYKIENYTKSIYPEEELSNIFKYITFKTNTNIIKYPKVSYNFI